jgi:hypothetical protein
LLEITKIYERTRFRWGKRLSLTHRTETKEWCREAIVLTEKGPLTAAATLSDMMWVTRSYDACDSDQSENISGERKMSKINILSPELPPINLFPF